MSLDYVSSIPLHYQLSKDIIKKINQGIYKERIPSERELMKEYRVSRSTVRHSINNLIQDGVLHTVRGKGTYVNLKPIVDWLGNLSSTSETIEQMGMMAGANLIESKIITLSHELREVTGLETAYYFVRIRYANKIPIGIEQHYYPISIGEELIKFDLNKEAFYHLIESKLGYKSFSAEQNITAVTANEKQIELLEINQRNICLLKTTRKISDIDGKFLEYEEAYYRSDMYSFNIRLSRKL